MTEVEVAIEEAEVCPSLRCVCCLVAANRRLNFNGSLYRRGTVEMYSAWTSLVVRAFPCLSNLRCSKNARKARQPESFSQNFLFRV
jgi:hypothetical protein